MKCWRSRLVVNVLILLAITLPTVVRCQDEQQATTDVADGGAAGADDVKDYLASGLRLEHELVKEQADDPSTRTSGESFVAIHVDALGAKEQLRPSLRGLSYIAISFLPKDFTLQEVHSATREVVAGVRYELVVKALDREQFEVFCKLTVLEKPWLTTESGDKYRILEYTNCTSAEYSTDRYEVVTKFNPIFDPNERSKQDMNPSRFKDLVNQIITEKKVEASSTSETEVLPTIATEHSTAPVLSESSMDVLDQLFMFGSEAQPPRIVATETNERNQEVVEEVIVPKRVEQPHSELTTTETSPPKMTTKSLDQQVQSTFEEVFKTHQEIQKALDEVIQRGGGRDVQQKYEPVFASLLQKVKTSIDNYYQTIHPGGGDANVDTTAFVIRDSVISGRNSTFQNSSESDDFDDQQQQQVIQPGFDELPSRPLEVPPKINAVVMQFSDDSDEQQQEDVQRPQTRDELMLDLNADDSQQRNKRAPDSHSFEREEFFDHNPFFGSHSHESLEHNGYQPYFEHRPYFGYNPYNNFQSYKNFNPYNHRYSVYPNYHQRGKRFVEMNLESSDLKQTTEMEKMISDAIEMLDHMDADLFKRILLEVISVKRINQFSSAIEQKGDLFVARVATANSHCIEEVEDTIKCKALLIEGSNKFCTLEIRVKDKEVRLVKSECVPNKLLGGHREVDLSEPEHQQRIQAGLKGYGKGKMRSSRFVIRCGTVQIVAGTIHRYTVDLVDKNDQVTNTCNVKIYTPLQNAPEYNFDCQEVSRRVARDVERKKISKGPKTGAPLELTPEEFGKPEHTERIQSILLTSGGANNERKYKIVEATQQVVAGTLYTYKLVFTDDPDKRVCKLTSHERPWLKEKSPSEAKKVSFTCPDASKNRPKRAFCAGCPSAISPNDLNNAEHKQRVNKILLAKVVGSQGALDSLSPQIINATTKVVQGIQYTYFVSFNMEGSRQTCKLTSWERPWLDATEAYEFKASCVEQDDSNSLRKRSKRSFCVGCPSAVTDLQDVEHKQRVSKILLAKVVASEAELQSMSPEIINATSQVVQGTLYTYFVAYNTQGTRPVCKLTSWERPWLDGADAYQYTAECNSGQDESNALRKRRAKSRSRRAYGSARVLTTEELQQDEHIKRVGAIMASSSGVNAQNPKIINGTVQVVAGQSYTYYVAYTVNDEERVCKLNSWERPWLADKQPSEAYKYTVNCFGTDDSSVTRARRHAKKTGASNELSAEDLKDKSHIERIKAGLIAYNTEKSKSYNDFEIVKGSVQLVAGSLYKYTFKINSEPEVICKISVWERVWLDTQDQRKYNVKCDGDDEPEQEQKLAASKRSARSVRPRQSESDSEGHYSKGEDHARHLFEKFKLKHSREYQSSLEHEMRFRIFKNNLFKIEQLNKYEQGTAKYGITHFADMTSSEYRQRTGLVVPRDEERNHVGNPIAKIDENLEIPEAFDWRELGAVSPVKNQGNCGSCWAFSVVGNIEGLHQIKTKVLEEYSEQELLDCDAVDSACQGGYMDDAYKAIEKIGGLELESEYPYLAKKQKTCHYNSTKVHVRVKGAVDLPKNETAMAQYLVVNGPISIGLNANAMQFYRGGISHPWRPLCSKKNLDHGVLIVGYGIKEYPMFNKTMPYWIVKNSWGPKWGEQGYYRIFRGDNTCGVSEMASSAVLE